MKKVVNFNGKDFNIEIEDFDEDINVEKLLKIDYSELFSEILCFPTIVNRFGIMLADMENNLNEKKFNLDVFEAKLKEKKRAEMMQENGGKAPTIDALNTAVLLDKGYQSLKKSLFQVQKERDYLNSIFWSAKSKDEKLAKLSLTVKPDDITIFNKKDNKK